MIRSHVDSSKQLTTHICVGKISLEELLTEVKSFYDGEPTLNTLWDMTEADFSDFDGPMVEKIAISVKSYVPTREGGKTAIVSNRDLAFGLGRMYQVFSEFEGVKAKTQVFRSLDEASAWLTELIPLSNIKKAKNCQS